MSITFYLSGMDDVANELNVSNVNGYELLRLINLPGITEEDYPCGSFLAKDFEVAVRRAMMRLNADNAILPSREGNVIFGGRPAGYLREKLMILMGICQQRKTSEAKIVWS